jgi:hypothetical protein
MATFIGLWFACTGIAGFLMTIGRHTKKTGFFIGGVTFVFVGLAFAGMALASKFM